jgi:hypothetical protein
VGRAGAPPDHLKHPRGGRPGRFELLEAALGAASAADGGLAGRLRPAGAGRGRTGPRRDVTGCEADRGRGDRETRTPTPTMAPASQSATAAAARTHLNR